MSGKECLSSSPIECLLGRVAGSKAEGHPGFTSEDSKEAHERRHHSSAEKRWTLIPIELESSSFQDPRYMGEKRPRRGQAQH
jgi:hypothetical protein